MSRGRTAAPPVGDWHQHAKCVGMDPDDFYPGPDSGGRSGHTALAERLCRGCPVKTPCLEEALATPSYDDHGIRGGMTSKARAHLRNGTQQRTA